MKREHIPFIALFILILLILLSSGYNGNLIGRAVIVLDEGVNADQISVIAELAGSGDETKMMSEVDLSQGGMLIFSGLNDGETALIKENKGNIYVSGNVNDAVAVLNKDYEKLLEENNGVIEIVNGEVVAKNVQEKDVLCEDTDGGRIDSEKGETSGYDENGNYVEHIDACSSDTWINEGECVDIMGKGVVFTGLMQCWGDTECVDGACATPKKDLSEEEIPLCEEFDWGAMASDGTEYQNECQYQNTYFTKWSCYDDKGDLIVVSQTYQCPYGCDDSYGCLEKKEEVDYGYTCEDSDGGADLFVKGVTKGYDENGNEIIHEDKCQWNMPGVYEGTCDYSTDTVYAAVYSCDEGYHCSEGICATDEVQETVGEEVSVAVADFLANLPSDTVIVIPSELSTQQMLGAVQIAGDLHISVVLERDYSSGPAIILGGNEAEMFTINNDVIIVSPGNADMREAVRQLLEY